MANILTVAEDEAFAIMLKDGLEGMGVHQVQLAYSGEEVQQIISNQDIDLAIVDVDLRDVEPVELVHAMRQRKPELRVMWMPFLGYELSDEMRAVNSQGILTKPFFMEDLADYIEQALSQPGPAVTSATSSVPEPEPAGMSATSLVPEPEPGTTETPSPGRIPIPETPSPGRIPISETTSPGRLPISDVILRSAGPVVVRETSPENVRGSLPDDPAIKDILNQLALELDAEAVVILNREGDLLARAGYMSQRRMLQLTSILMGEIEVADNAAAFLNETSGRFVNSIHEGEESRLFSVILSDSGLALSVITFVETPFGTVRYHVRQAATKLTGLIQGVE